MWPGLTITTQHHQNLKKIIDGINKLGQVLRENHLVSEEPSHIDLEEDPTLLRKR